MKRIVVAMLLVVLAAPLSAQQWIRLERGDHPITVPASGIVVSADTLRFGPPPNRRWRIAITHLASEGARVKAGDVLARFDGSATDDRIRTLSADLNAKQSELESLLETQASETEDAKVRLAAARSAADKAARKAAVDAELFASLEYRKLVEEREITQQLLAFEQERIELAERVREAKKAELEADIRRLQSELAGAQRELESFTITAPRDGLVIIGVDREGQKLDVNEQVNPGMIVVELANEDELLIQAEVPEFAANRVRPGQDVRITIEAAGGSQLAGTVLEVGSVVRRQSRFSQAMVLDVEVSLPGEVIGQLRSGMTAKLDIEVDTQRNALALPDAALQYRDGEPGVIVRGDGWRPVVLGRVSGGMHIIEQGLEAGEEVAL